MIFLTKVGNKTISLQQKSDIFLKKSNIFVFSVKKSAKNCFYNILGSNQKKNP